MPLEGRSQLVDRDPALAGVEQEAAHGGAGIGVLITEFLALGLEIMELGQDCAVHERNAVDGRPVWRVSFLDRSTPAWFTIFVDRATYRTLRVDMVAQAHGVRSEVPG